MVWAVAETISEPKALAPGEKLLVTIDRKKGEGRLYDHHELQQLCARRWHERTGVESDGTFAGAIVTGGPTTGAEIPGYTSAGPAEPIKVEDRVLGVELVSRYDYFFRNPIFRDIILQRSTVNRVPA